ncbi:uncharacterized protein N7477_000885 [Penicillium maclennaniae]|uniref:uncharacterized protein n=1 Tax=Penicillium maclennaniae TaxID=1343394 RepID=UPI002541DC7C|nr:uncharacterized protein N7477_000885 [Penicillium maclennaniae]KAJ5684540.1 hypothetical protein N7477_000885 [Penicillium maclennaniae]
MFRPHNHSFASSRLCIHSLTTIAGAHTYLSTQILPEVKNFHAQRWPPKSKKGSDNLNSKLALVIKSGKVTLGAKSTMKTLRSGKAKLSELEYYAMLAKTPVHHFSGNNIELGTACGKLFRCATMAILDAGDSDILSANQ